MQIIIAISVFMLGESFRFSPASIFVIPFIPLMKPLAASRMGSRIYSLVLVPCAVVTACTAVWRFSKMTGTLALPNTPVFVIAAITAAVSAYLAAGGGLGIVKWSAVSFFAAAGFLIIAICLLAGKFQFDGFCYRGIWEDPFWIMGCEMVTILFIMPVLRHNERPFRTFLAAAGIAFSFWMIVQALTNLTLGSDTACMAPYPFFSAMRIANGGELIGRVEAFLTPVLFGMTVLKTALSFHAVIIAVKRVCKAPGDAVKQ